MKKALLISTILFTLAACGGEAANQPKSAEKTIDTTAAKVEKTSVPKPSSDEFDTLKLAYINLNRGAVRCEKSKIDKWSFAACQYISLDGNTAPQIWYYDNQKDPQKRYYAFTGKARSTYAAKMKGNPMLGDYAETFGLPIPEDMDMGKITEVFNKKMK